MTTKNSLPKLPIQSEPLKIKNLSKNYGELKAVKNVSLTLKPGEIFGLLGPNGAGKSTLINMIAGLTKIQTGSISIFGYDNKADFRETRRLTGIMHQELVIEKFFSVEKILKMYPGYYGFKDDPSWRSMLVDRLALTPYLNKKYISLSGGMRRRLMVAKALIHRPALLILDEPTAGVDVELRRGLWEFVSEINRAGTTVLLTTHYLEEAEMMCERIAIMNHGEIKALETTSDLINKIGTKKITLTLQKSLLEFPKTVKDQFGKQCIDISTDKRQISFHTKNEQQIPDILSLLHKNSISITDITSTAPALEDVFISLTSN